MRIRSKKEQSGKVGKTVWSGRQWCKDETQEESFLWEKEAKCFGSGDTLQDCPRSLQGPGRGHGLGAVVMQTVFKASSEEQPPGTCSSEPPQVLLLGFISLHAAGIMFLGTADVAHVGPDTALDITVVLLRLNLKTCRMQVLWGLGSACKFRGGLSDQEACCEVRAPVSSP